MPPAKLSKQIKIYYKQKHGADELDEMATMF